MYENEKYLSQQLDNLNEDLAAAIRRLEEEHPERRGLSQILSRAHDLIGSVSTTVFTNIEGSPLGR